MGLQDCCSCGPTISAERISHTGYTLPVAFGATCHTCAHGPGYCWQACGHDVNGHYLFVNSAGAGTRGIGDLGLFWAVRRGRVQVHLVFDIETGVLSADLSGNDMAQVNTLACRLMHPTHSGFDQQLTLRRGPDGRLHGDFSRLTEARWIIQIGAQDWRLVGRIDLTQSAALDLSPQAVTPSS